MPAFSCRQDRHSSGIPAPVDVGERYYELSRLGRDTFLDSVAQGSLVLVTSPMPVNRLARGSSAGDLTPLGIAAKLPAEFGAQRNKLWILPLTKKQGTPFVDLITLGRTANNDVTVADMSISRFHAFFRRRGGRWFICDAGSSNGTTVAGKRLEPRTEAEVPSGCTLVFGAVCAEFHSADSLFDFFTTSPVQDV